MRDALVVIERRFRGPPESGQGGYTCGLLAREIPPSAEVLLRIPPPLERQLALELEEGQGLRLFPGPVGGRNVIACFWRPDAALADDNGLVQTEFVWAALDGPTASACDLTGPPIVFVRLTSRFDQALHGGEQYIITAGHIGREGRKQHAAQARWIELKDPTVFGAATSRLDSTTRAPVASTPDLCASLKGSPG